ncbi:unnamed protein product [Ambrosiozyma monospora]|uniref:Unnamed protein product n=1 Tax=Ambrosiozyma monospora TaxID=43982 RepID=A0ACB5TA04_AMBMO|nr:unnamed protein product [Ambrosiozyma monospora]
MPSQTRGFTTTQSIFLGFILQPTSCFPFITDTEDEYITDSQLSDVKLVKRGLSSAGIGIIFGVIFIVVVLAIIVVSSANRSTSGSGSDGGTTSGDGGGGDGGCSGGDGGSGGGGGGGDGGC